MTRLKLWIIAIMSLLVSSQVQAVSYSSADIGTVSLNGHGAWSSGVSFAWEVNNEVDPDGYWTYTYTFSAAQKALSHIVIEVSDNFEASDIISTSGDVAFTPVELGTHGNQGKSSPNIPEPFYGIKWDLTGDSTTFQWTLVTTRDPVWGDFYAKDGKTGGVDNAVYNSGFGSPDTDPNLPPTASILDHILRPDSISTLPPPSGDEPSIPEPGTIVLAFAGIMLSGLKRWYSSHKQRRGVHER